MRQPTLPLLLAGLLTGVGLAAAAPQPPSNPRVPALTDATFFEDLARVPDVSIDSGEPQGPVCAGIEVPVTF